MAAPCTQMPSNDRYGLCFELALIANYLQIVYDFNVIYALTKQIIQTNQSERNSAVPTFISSGRVKGYTQPLASEYGRYGARVNRIKSFLLISR